MPKIKKSVKKSLSKISPKEYKESVIRALEIQLSDEKDRSKKLQKELDESRAIIITLRNANHNIVDENSHWYDTGHRDGYTNGLIHGRKHWYKFWVKK